MGNLSITYLKISQLKSYLRKARTHTKKQIRQIAASIGENGRFTTVES